MFERRKAIIVFSSITLGCLLLVVTVSTVLPIIWPSMNSKTVIGIDAASPLPVLIPGSEITKYYAHIAALNISDAGELLSYGDYQKEYEDIEYRDELALMFMHGIINDVNWQGGVAIISHPQVKAMGKSILIIGALPR